MTMTTLTTFLSSWESTTARLRHVLINTLIAKGVDVSAVYDGVDISFKKHLALSDDKTKIVLT